MQGLGGEVGSGLKGRPPGSDGLYGGAAYAIWVLFSWSGQYYKTLSWREIFHPRVRNNGVEKIGAEMTYFELTGIQHGTIEGGNRGVRNFNPDGDEGQRCRRAGTSTG